MKYQVFIDDNFHYMDETERITDGVFDTAAAAVAACKEIVDKSLRHLYKQHPDTAERLYDDYMDFGDDPFIRSDAPDCKFSGWGYAKHRAKDIVAELSPLYNPK